MTRQLSLQDQTTEFLLYTAPDGEVKVEVLLSNETIWLTQERMAELFGVQRPAITKHLKNIFESNELQEEVVCSILEHTTEHGAIKGKTQTSKVKYYNLDAVISVGYRVNSAQATRFRIWATQLIKEYIIKGFAMDDERLKTAGFLVRIILKSYWSGYALSAPVSGAFISRSPISLLNAASTTTRSRKSPTSSMPMFRTSFITPLPGILRRNSLH